MLSYLCDDAVICELVEHNSLHVRCGHPDLLKTEVLVEHLDVLMSELLLSDQGTDDVSEVLLKRLERVTTLSRVEVLRCLVLGSWRIVRDNELRSCELLNGCLLSVHWLLNRSVHS